MKKNELNELINASLDGVITPEQKAILDDELRNNPSAKQEFDEMAAMNELLLKDSRNQKDVDFSREIMNSINKDKYAAPVKESSFWNTFNFAFSNNLRYASVFSLGLLVGVICYITFFKVSVPGVNENEISGTMVDISRPPNFSKGESVIIDNNGVKANIASYYQNDMIMTEIKVKSDDNISMNFSFNDQNLKVYALKSFNTKAESNIVSGNGIIQISSRGENTFLMLFKNKANSKEKIDINVYSGISKIFNSKILAN